MDKKEIKNIVRNIINDLNDILEAPIEENVTKNGKINNIAWNINKWYDDYYGKEHFDLTLLFGDKKKEYEVFPTDCGFARRTTKFLTEQITFYTAPIEERFNKEQFKSHMDESIFATCYAREIKKSQIDDSTFKSMVKRYATDMMGATEEEAEELFNKGFFEDMRNE